MATRNLLPEFAAGVPNITELKEELQYGDVKEPLGLKFWNHVRVFREFHVSSSGTLGCNLVTWRDTEHLDGLIHMAKKYLEHYGPAFWPNDSTSSAYNKLQQFAHAAKIEALLAQLFFRLNLQQYRNNKYKLKIKEQSALLPSSSRGQSVGDPVDLATSSMDRPIQKSVQPSQTSPTASTLFRETAHNRWADSTNTVAQHDPYTYSGSPKLSASTAKPSDRVDRTLETPSSGTKRPGDGSIRSLDHECKSLKETKRLTDSPRKKRKVHSGPTRNSSRPKIPRVVPHTATEEQLDEADKSDTSSDHPFVDSLVHALSSFEPLYTSAPLLPRFDEDETPIGTSSSSLLPRPPQVEEAVMSDIVSVPGRSEPHVARVNIRDPFESSDDESPMYPAPSRVSNTFNAINIKTEPSTIERRDSVDPFIDTPVAASPVPETAAQQAASADSSGRGDVAGRGAREFSRTPPLSKVVHLRIPPTKETSGSSSAGASLKFVEKNATPIEDKGKAVERGGRQSETPQKEPECPPTPEAPTMELSFNIVLARMPRFRREKWTPKGKFMRKSLPELKAELPAGFGDDTPGLLFRLRGPDIETEHPVHHDNDHDFDNLKRFFVGQIRNAMNQHKGGEHLNFTIEIEALRGEFVTDPGMDEDNADMF